MAAGKQELFGAGKVAAARPQLFWADLETSRFLIPGVLVLYALGMRAAILHHEPWADEAQAWLLARETNPFTLLTEWLPYEGHPGLWHLLLMLPARFLPYEALNVISGLLAGLAAYLVLRRSPFPLIVKLLLPFTFFLFFQYGVVARNYSLLPLMIFLVAIAYSERNTKPYKFAGLLFLLANVSAHGFFMAAGIMAVSFLGLLRRWRSSDLEVLKKNIIAAAAFGVGMIALALLLRPPPERDVSPPSTEPVIGKVLTGGAEIVTGALAGSRWLMWLVLLVSIFFFWRARVLLLWFLPTAGILLFSELVYRSAWHEGTVFLFWVFALWVGLERLNRSSGGDLRVKRVMMATLVVVCSVQIWWTIGSVQSDHDGPYSGSKALANFIMKRSLDDSVIYGIGFSSIAVTPYFEQNIYDNYHDRAEPSFWVWSSENDMIEDPIEIEERKPDYIVATVKVAGVGSVLELFPSYRLHGIFPGWLYWKTVTLEPDFYLLLQRVNPPAPV